MAVIDFIEEGKPMPDWVLDFETFGPDRQMFTMQDVKEYDLPPYTFVPYFRGNINCCEVTDSSRDVISSRFSGCLMGIWKGWDGSVFVGHITTDPDETYDCKELWAEKMSECKCGWAFKPSDFILPLPPGVLTWKCFGLFTFNADLTAYAAFSIITENNAQGVPNTVLKKVLVRKGTLI